MFLSVKESTLFFPFFLSFIPLLGGSRAKWLCTDTYQWLPFIILNLCKGSNWTFETWRACLVVSRSSPFTSYWVGSIDFLLYIICAFSQAKWLFTDTCHSQSLPRFKLDFSNLDKHVWSFLRLRYLLGNELVHRLSILFVPFPGVLYYTFSNWAAVPVRESARGISHPSFNLGRFKDGSSFFVSYHFFFFSSWNV